MNDYQQPNTPYTPPESNVYSAQTPENTLKHSGLGIISFILSLIGGITLFGIVVIAAMKTASGDFNENSSEAVLLGLMMFGMIGIEVIAFILGIIAWLQKDRKKTFAIIGTIISLVSGLGMIGLIVLGLLLG